MIAYLSGKIIKKTDRGIILDTGNIGYLVHLSKTIITDLEERQELSLFIHSHIREDAFDLYGFNTYEELGFFKQLISINGIGPKVAMEILSVPPEKSKAAILNEDDKFLCKIPGIGPKIAKRIVLELKGKIDMDITDRAYKNLDEKIDDEAFDALSKLGYQTPQIRKILNNLPSNIKATEEIITDESNITYLSNFTGSSGFMLLVGKKHYLFTDFRYIERAKNSIKKRITLIDNTRMWRNPEVLKENWHRILIKHKIKKIGIEENNLTISRFKKFQKFSKIKGQKITFQNISGKIESLREIKSKKEIELTIKSQRINEKVFLLIKKLIQTSLGRKAKITESGLVWKIKEFAHDLGADGISFEPIVAFGKHSSMPHHLPDKTVLKKGDLVMIDMGIKYRGYCSDMTRMIFTKPPTKEEKQIYNLVLKAQENAINKIKAGLTGKKADNLARDIIKKAGFGESYGHAGGHGIGLDIHESPSLSENYKDKILENTIITVEPGIYLEGKFGVRIEDMVLVTKSGTKNLTKISKKLI